MKRQAKEHNALREFGLVERGTPKKSVPLVLHLPKSLRLALERQANREEVTLAQLVTTKLAVQLRDMVAS